MRGIEISVNLADRVPLAKLSHKVEAEIIRKRPEKVNGGRESNQGTAEQVRDSHPGRTQKRHKVTNGSHSSF